MPSYKLTYFPIRGRAATVRYMLIDNEQSYEEINVSLREWPSVKPTCVFGQMPILTVDGTFTLFQSNAIARYLAREFDLYGKGNQEASQIDMVVEGVKDLREKVVKVIFQNNEKEKASFIEKLSGELATFETILKTNHGGNDFIVGDKMSLADYDLFAIVDGCVTMDPDCLANLPLLQEFHKRIASRPRVAAYRSTEAFKSLPNTGMDLILARQKEGSQ